MDHRPYEPEHPQERPRQSRGRPDAAKTGGAQGLVRQTEWLWHPVLFWTGGSPPDLASEEMPYTPLPSLLAERLESERPGLFTAHLVWPPASSLPGLDVNDARTHLDPRIHCRRVTSRQLSRAAEVLVASRRYPRALPKVVDDPDAWTRAVERRLERIRAVFDLSRAGASPTARLEMEASCAWVGPAAERPSRTVAAEVLHDLATGGKRSWTRTTESASPTDVAAVAALALGQRRAPGSVPAAGRSFHRLGRAYSGWPLNVLSDCAGVPATRRTLMGFSRHPASSWLDGPDVALALIEHRAAARMSDIPEAAETLPPFSGLLRLLDALKRAQEGAPCPLLAASLLGLTGRLGGRLVPDGAPEDFLAACADWTDICLQLVRRGYDGCDPLRVATETLAVAAAHTGGEAARLQHVARLLARGGAEVLNAAGSGNRSADRVRVRLSRIRKYGDVPVAAALGRSPSLPVEDLGLLFRHGLFGGYARVVGRSPEYGDLALRWARALLETLGEGSEGTLPSWTGRIFPTGWTHLVALRDRALADRITTWFLNELRSRDPRRMSPLPSLLEGMSLFLSPGNPRLHERAQFLRKHWFLWERLLEAIPRDGADHDRKVPDRATVDASLADAVEVFLAAMYWEREAGRDPRPLCRDILGHDVWLERCAGWTADFTHPGESLSLAVHLAEGEGRTLVGLLREARHHFWRRTRGTGRAGAMRLRTLLDRVAALRSLVHEAAPDPVHGKRLLDALHRGALAVRLFPSEDEREWAEEWISPSPVDPATHDFEFPDFLGPRQRERLEALAAYRSLAGDSSPLPSAIREILHRRRKLEGELRWLEERRETGRLPEGARPRMVSLQEILNSPGRVEAWVQEDLEKKLPERLVRARLEALDACADRAIARFWTERLGSVPDVDSDRAWENALSLYLSLQDSGSNRKILRRLLEARLAGQRDWHLEHPENRRVLARLRDAGIDPREWLADHAITTGLGGESWTAYTEEDPLKVLRMGELFGTCLAPRGVHDYSAVANAVEVNKRVLYLEAGARGIVGRKLVAVSTEGLLIGFNSYGRSDRRLAFPEWVKILFDQLCLRLADRAGLRLYHAPDPEVGAAHTTAILRPLELFAEGYIEWPEPFDTWVVELSEGAEARDLLEHLGDRDEDEAARLVLWVARHHSELLDEALDGWRPCEEVRDRLRANTDRGSLLEWLR